jgi:membrane fusion protein (multidrug efflux system)
MAIRKEKLKLYIPLVVVVAIVLAGSIYWYIDYSSYIKTDDAYVTSDVVTVSPKIMGRISKIYAEEGDMVKAGDLLAELDSSDLIAQRQQLESMVLQTEAGISQAEAKYQYDLKNIEVLRIGMERAKEDLERAQAQYSGGVMTKEQFEHLKKAKESAEAQFAAAQAQIQVSKTLVESANAAKGTALAQIEIVQTQLRNTKLYAPADGVIAKRWLLPGDIVTAGQSVYTVNNDSKFWVTVYLEETKVGNLRIGEKAKFTLDTYPGIVFTGEVFLLGSTTASQFSLIPPSNASGNFTKVTQRIPLKISIDGVETGQDVHLYRLMTGMSAVVKIVRQK